MGENRNSKWNWATAKKSCFCLFTPCTGISCSISQLKASEAPPDLGILNIFDSLGKEIGFCLDILRCPCGFHPFQSSTLIFSCCFPSSSHHFLHKTSLLGAHHSPACWKCNNYYLQESQVPKWAWNILHVTSSWGTVIPLGTGRFWMPRVLGVFGDHEIHPEKGSGC